MKKLLAMVTFLAAVGVSAESALFDNGKTDWTIRISAKSPQPVVFAASELASFLKQSSQAEFPVAKPDDKAPEKSVVIGEPGTSEEIRNVFPDLKNSESDEVRILFKDNRLYLAGNNPRSAAYAVYRFLDDQLDIRFLWYYDDGTFVPAHKTFVLSDKVNYSHKCCFPFRSGGLCGDPYFKEVHYWMFRNYANMLPNLFGGEITNKTGALNLWSGHTVYVEKEMVEKHPEYFAMIQGKRNFEIGETGCWSNPGFFQHVLDRHVKKMKGLDHVTLFPADNDTRCECEECMKIPDTSTRWYQFYEKLATELRKTYPQMQFSGIAYQDYRKVPETPVKGLEFVAYCQYDRCYMHKLDDPSCVSNQKSMDAIRKWLAKAPMGVYGYHFDIYKDPTAYLPFWNMLADELRTWQKLGFRYTMTEMEASRPNPKLEPWKNSTYMHRLAHYIWFQLAWDPAQDVNVLLRKFCRSAYGPAWEEIYAYHSAMAKAWDSLKIHVCYFHSKPAATARSYITPDLIAEAKKHFAAAEDILEKLPDGPDKTRWQREVGTERELFAQWELFGKFANENIIFVNLPERKGVKTKDLFAGAPKFHLLSHTKMRQPGFVQFARTEDALHVHVELVRDMTNFEQGLAGHDDANVWRGDYVEIFLDPQGTGYRHLTINSGAGYYDAYGMDTKWDPEWSRTTKIEKDRWILNVTLPWKMFGITPKNGDNWSAVVDYYRHKGGNQTQFGFPSPLYHDVSGGCVLHFTEAEYAP